MKRIPTAALLCLSIPAALCAQEPAVRNDWTKRVHPIPEVTVVGQRPMKEIGVQQTKFDSTVLKEHI
ncbi:MAG: hypothetical protein K2H77_05800, partial [Alistipes sp.]|nr:hypothetical protein [Alistipes sp.]